jgi:hypothetical protein
MSGRPSFEGFSRGFLMFDSETTTLLRTVLDEVCEQVSLYEHGTTAHAASKLLEAAAQGEPTSIR